MCDTYEFIAYLCVDNRIVGMRIRIFGDIGGNSVFDVPRKLLDKYGVAYNLADKVSERLELTNDDIPELSESFVGFNKWLLYSSKKFGVSEFFTCDKIRDCSMCPLSRESGYCTGEYGVDLCKRILGLRNVCIQNLVGYLNTHKSLLCSVSERRKAINYVKDIIENKEVAVDEKAIASAYEVEQIITAQEEVVSQEEVVESKEVSTFQENSEPVVMVKSSVSNVREVRHSDTKSSKPRNGESSRVDKPLSRIKQLRIELMELNSKLFMTSALSRRLSLFDDNIFVDKQELSLRKKIQSKQNELDLLIGK